MRMYKEKRKEGTNAVFKAIITESFPELIKILRPGSVVEC